MMESIYSMIIGGAIAWSVVAELPPVGLVVGRRDPGEMGRSDAGAVDRRDPGVVGPSDPGAMDHLNPGVAGAFTGVSGGVLLIAGGSNFPAGKPWEGGKKAYCDEVYVLRRETGGRFSCKALADFRLPAKIAYGCSVTVPSGIVCIGGETPAGYSTAVFLLSWDAGAEKPAIRNLPSLPHGLANACATAIGSRIYVAGGEDAHSALAGVYTLDLDVADPRWEPLPPLPVAMSHSVAVTQSVGEHTYVYIIGGRTKTDSGISELHSTLLRFDPVRLAWQRMADIGEGRRTTHLSAASAVAADGGILVIGGDRGEIFHQIEVCNARIVAAKTAAVKNYYTRRKLALVGNHPGFSRVVLAYDAAADSWKKIGSLPGEAPVTTTAVTWKGEIFIPGGELHPGVRSRAIWRGVVSRR